ncbi:hypothetical protein [Natronorubrum daqingense]|uniref:Uncharacterized protein n=1 Tax=Natronorubrum daqingense TaxID=588898 RepID=A0A1N7GAK0_9EURY|nr:hypothetical protein [Natronorubrum daqingense]SIS09546.1 hypothetical protein SAMN05421809_3841 [Natronorubrum daqingense]
MTGDPHRDLHNAALRSNDEATIFQEYHHRRKDTQHRLNASVAGFDNGAVIVHVASPAYFQNTPTNQVDVGQLQQDYDNWPIVKTGDRLHTNSKLDSRGIVAHQDDPFENRETVTRVDRSGILEAVSTSVLSNRNNNDEETSQFVTSKFEKGLVSLVDAYIERLREGNQEGTLVTVSYVNLDGVLIRTRGGFSRHSEIKDTPVRTPVTILGDGNLRDELTPVIQPLWNAIGYSQSSHMRDGEWEFES